MTALPRAHSTPDPRARFEALVRRHQVGVWRFLRWLGASADEAEDLLQETFLVAWRRGLEDLGPGPTAAFLRRTAQHLFLRSSRARGRREALIAELAEREWSSDCAADDGAGWLVALDACLERLPPRTRAAVRDWYCGGDRDAVGERHGLLANGLKTLLQRARAALRDCLERTMRGRE